MTGVVKPKSLNGREMAIPAGSDRSVMFLMLCEVISSKPVFSPASAAWSRPSRCPIATAASEQRLLIILSNCQYLEKHTFINLAEHFEKHGFHGTEKITRMSHLDRHN
ncbi:UNVERIFIED_CONTAM: hypothetical protein FKN15_070766 [Acipenser sinensis]